MRTWSKTNNLSGWAWRQASKQASRQPRGYRNCNKTKNVFRGKPRRLKLEQMHMNVYIFKQVSPSLKGPLQLYALHGPMFLFVDRLGFSLSSLGLFPNCVRISKKYTFLAPTHQPEPGSVSTTSVQNKQPPAPPRRQESRNSAAPNERQQDIQQPKTLVFGDKPASSWPRKQDPKN